MKLSITLAVADLELAVSKSESEFERVSAELTQLKAGAREEEIAKLTETTQMPAAPTWSEIAAHLDEALEQLRAVGRPRQIPFYPGVIGQGAGAALAIDGQDIAQAGEQEHR